MSTLVKICGVCDADGARAAVGAGADMIGLHFCPSRRRVTPDEALAIVEALPDRPRLVGVFIDEDPDEVGRIAERVGLDAVQLHGSEAPGRPHSRPVIKTLKVRDGVVPDAAPWPDPVLLDSWSPDGRGGTGRRWPWEQARELVAGRRVIVAGGLTPDNVGELVSRLRPYGVDVSSGVESAPRVKDPQLIRHFVQAVRDADAAR